MLRILMIAFVLLILAGCSTNNVDNNDGLKKYFDENKVSGCFALFDNSKGRFTIYNVSRFSDSTYLPASTFKIVNSLIGIETGRVKDDSTVFNWDGVTRSVSEWNRDLAMRDAFKVSSVPWFQELARRIGRDTMQHWLDTLGYASRYEKSVIQNNLDTFWLDNSVKITPDEQLGLVKKLYFDQLPFQTRSQRIVKEMMLQESNSNFELSYKTGWGRSMDDHAIGWIVGWIKENNHLYFFVLNIESSQRDYDIPAAREKILKGIMRELGFFEGKM